MPIMDRIRRKILAAGAAATAMAAAPRAFGEQTGQGGAAMSVYEKGPVRIHYEEAGSGFRLLLIAGGGLNSTISGLTRGDPFNPIQEFKGEYRCIASDLRNANGGQSSGPLEIDRPWDAYADDQLGLMGSPAHRQVHGDGLLHWRPLHLEPLEAGTRSYCHGRAGAAQRVASGDARPFLRNQYEGLGSGADRPPARHHDGDGRQISDEDVPHQPRLRLHRDARFRAELPDALTDPAG